jgi:5'-3' exonuclease
LNERFFLILGMCVLAGCDFLPSVPGIGVARAHALVSKYRNIDRVSFFFSTNNHYR